MLSEKYAFMAATQAMYLESQARDKTCAISEMGPNLFKGYHVIVWKKDFPYGPLLNYYLKKMIESGVVHNILSKYKIKKPEGCLGTGLDALSINNMTGIF